MHFVGNSADGLQSRRDCCWSCIVSVFENKPKNLVVQGRVQLEHSSHIVKVDVEATRLHFNCYWRKCQTHLELCDRNLDILERMLNQIVLFSSSYKATWTRANFNSWGAKMILLSDELWLLDNNSKSFANRNKSLIRNSLGLFKDSKINLI